MGLTKPDTSENVTISQLTGDLDLIDDAAGLYVCTSSTRPSSPYQGQLIYETDTQAVAYYNGSAWSYISGEAISWTPSYNNITVGNGTVTAWKSKSADYNIYYWKLVWGSTTSFSSTPGLSLPDDVYSGYGLHDVAGSAFYYDNSVGSPSRQGGTVVFNTSGSHSVFFTADDAAGQTVTTSVPFTWSTSDVISAIITHRRA